MSRHVLWLCQLEQFSYSCTALYCCLGTALSFDFSSLSLQTEVNFHQKGAQLWCRFPAYGRPCWEGVVSGLVSRYGISDTGWWQKPYKSHTVNCGNVIYLTKGCSCNLLYHMWGFGDWSLAYHFANPRWPFLSRMIFNTYVLFEDFFWVM
jgi:hypothetical protein